MSMWIAGTYRHLPVTATATSYHRVYHLTLLTLFACLLLVMKPALSSQSFCVDQCTIQVDYQHATSALAFSRYYLPSLPQAASDYTSGEQLPVRHRYDIVLTRQGLDWVIFDELGNRHQFTQLVNTTSANGGYLGTSTASGHLTVNGDEAQWINAQGITHRFHGSLLTSISLPEGETLQLHYKKHVLDSITDPVGNAIHLVYENNQLQSISTPEGEILPTPIERCDQLERAEPDVCDTSKNPLPDFEAKAHNASIQYLDIRPASCQSYFIDYYGAERGARIETAIANMPSYASMEQTVRSFPIIDFVNDRELISLQSRDLASPTFNDPARPNALLYQLLRDGKTMHQLIYEELKETGAIVVEESGQTTMLQNDPQHRLSLHLVVRHQMASSAQWVQIEQAREELERRYGIGLEVIVIP